MSLYDYAEMLFRSARIDAFRAAIDRVVEPGMRVLDLGTGLGTYAMFAARAGARVTALDSDRVIHLARSLAERNGLADRIEFVHGRAPEALPRERWDLVIFEDYSTPFVGAASHGMLRAIAADHLAPGGRLLPDGFRLGLTPVSTVGPGAADPGEGSDVRFGLSWTDLRHQMANCGQKAFLPADALIAPPEPGPRRPILPVPAPADLEVRAAWDASERPVTGLALWFDLDLGDGVWVSNEPGRDPDRVAEPWGQWLLPVDPPLSAPGTRMEARVWWETRADGLPGWMGWSCTAGHATRRGHEFAGIPLSLDDLTGGKPEAP